MKLSRPKWTRSLFAPCAPHNRWWSLTYFAIAVFACAPFWAYPYFPSQDGPSHLYNAVVLADYNHVDLYQDYYTFHFREAGNILSQLVLAGLVKFVDPHFAEKLFLTAYVLLFLICYGYLLAKLTPSAIIFLSCAFLFLSNFFLLMGFWNFCISIPLLFFSLGYYLTHRSRWDCPSATVFFIASALLYFTHMFTWAILALAVALFLLTSFVELFHKSNKSLPDAVRRLARIAAIPLGGLAAPAVLFLVQLNDFNPSRAFRDTSPLWSAQPAAVAEYSLWCLRMGADHELLVLHIAAVALGLLFAAVVAYKIWREEFLSPVDVWLVLSISCTIMLVIGPDRLGAGGYIRLRFAIFAYLFLATWLAAQRFWPRWTLGLVGIGFCILSVALLGTRLPVYERWNRHLEEFMTVDPYIRSGTTVLAVPLNLDIELGPMLHAVDHLTPKPFIDLRNYEAAYSVFLTSFRAKRSPFNRLGTLSTLEGDPPAFRIHKYEAETPGRVDYVLFYGLLRGAEQFPEATAYANELGDYEVVFVSAPNRLVRLYRKLRSE